MLEFSASLIHDFGHGEFFGLALGEIGVQQYVQQGGSVGGCG